MVGDSIVTGGNREPSTWPQPRISRPLQCVCSCVCVCVCADTGVCSNDELQEGDLSVWKSWQLYPFFCPHARLSHLVFSLSLGSFWSSRDWLHLFASVHWSVINDNVYTFSYASLRRCSCFLENIWVRRWSLLLDWSFSWPRFTSTLTCTYVTYSLSCYEMERGPNV